MYRDFYYLVKSAGYVHLYLRSGDRDHFLSTMIVDEAVHRSRVTMVRCAEIQGLVMKIPVPSHHTPCFWSVDGGRTFRPIAAPPSISKPWEGIWFVLSNGFVLFIPIIGSTLWFSGLVGKDWTPYPLPDSFFVWDASVGEDQTIYFAGEIRDLQGAGEGRQGIVAALGKDGFEFLSPRFATRDIRRLRNHGGDQSFTRIEATEHPIVVASDCYSCADSLVLSDLPSETFVFTENRPNWSLIRLNTQLLHIVREPRRSVDIYTYDACRYARPYLSDGWQEDKLILEREAWARGESNAKLELTAVSIREDALIVGVTLYPSDDACSTALGGYILRSDDRGKSFDLIVSKPGDVEVCGILSAD